MKALAWWAGCVLLCGCSFTRFDSDECSANADCRSAFGIGFVCADDGLCAPAPEEPRCATTFPPDLLSNPGDRIVLATMGDYSLLTHVARANAVELALDDANDSGGLEGRDFALIRCDIREDATMFDGNTRLEASLQVAQWLEDVAGVPVVIGPPGSDEVIMTYGATHDVVLMSPSATSPRLTSLESTPSDAAPGRVWRTAPPDVEQAIQIGADVRSRGGMDVMLVAQTGAYGDGLAELLTPEIPGMTVVRFSTEGQLTSALGMAADAMAPEVIIASSDTDDYIDFLTAAISEAGLTDTRFFLTDAAANQDFVGRLPDNPALRARIRGTRPSKDPELADEFERRYRVAYGDDPLDLLSFTAHSYDAGWLSLYAIVWSLQQEGGVTPLGVSRGLRQLSSGTALNVGDLTWTSVIEEFSAGRSIDIRGASGALDYDPATEERSESGQSFEVWLLNDAGDSICRVDDAACISG